MKRWSHSLLQRLDRSCSVHQKIQLIPLAPERTGPIRSWFTIEFNPLVPTENLTKPNQDHFCLKFNLFGQFHLFLRAFIKACVDQEVAGIFSIKSGQHVCTYEKTSTSSYEKKNVLVVSGMINYWFHYFSFQQKFLSIPPAPKSFPTPSYRNFDQSRPLMQKLSPNMPSPRDILTNPTPY